MRVCNPDRSPDKTDLASAGLNESDAGYYYGLAAEVTNGAIQPLKSEGDKRIRHYDADGNIIDLGWQLRRRGTCLIHTNEYCRCRIVLERSKANT
jgi:hypothetical protein